jgi:NAD(P)-dependent dehydrogenase (short-subunit alcohol dehydrogenase family)
MAAVEYGLEGKVAVVTGAASGIGRATAELFAGQGAHVVASDIEGEAGAELAEELRAAGGSALFVAADVRDDEAVSALIARAVQEHGRLDCAANCAGVGGGHGATHDYDPDAWNRIVDINLRGTWIAMRHEIAALLGGGGGTVVNTASTLSLRGSPFGSPYSASKHGVLGLTKTAALEYATQGIRVNAVCPGAIDTPMMDETFARFPGFREMLIGLVQMRMGRPEEVAQAIAWLTSDGSSFVTGAGITIEGGLLAR